jgi:hypothetical protein
LLSNGSGSRPEDGYRLAIASRNVLNRFDPELIRSVLPQVGRESERCPTLPTSPRKSMQFFAIRRQSLHTRWSGGTIKLPQSSREGGSPLTRSPDEGIAKGPPPFEN